METPVPPSSRNQSHGEQITLYSIKDLVQSIIGAISQSKTETFETADGIGKHIKDLLNEVRESFGHEHPKEKLAGILKNVFHEKIGNLKSREDHEKQKFEDDHIHPEDNTTST